MCRNILLFGLFLYCCLPFQIAVARSASKPAAEFSDPDTYARDTARVNKLNRLAFENFSLDTRKLHRYSRQAEALAKSIGYAKGEAEACRNMALSYMLLHGDIISLNYLNKALKLFEAAHDTVQIAGVINYMGCYYATLKDFPKALPFFLKSEKIIAGRKHPVKLTVLSNTGSCYEDLKQYSKASHYYNQVAVLANQMGNHRWTVISNFQKASLLMVSGHLTDALKLLDKSLLIAEKYHIGSRDIQAIHLLAAKINYQLHRFDSTRKNYERAHSIANAMNSREGMADVYRGLYQLDSIAGDQKNALTHFRKYTSIHDSLINQNKNQLATLFKIRFNLGEEEAENRKLVIEKEAQDKVIFYQRISLLILILLAVVSAVAYFRLSKVNQQLNALNRHIAHQNHELTHVNTIKSKLLSVIAHDLRSPFAQLLGLLKIIESKLFDPEDLIEHIPGVTRSAQQTMVMMDNLLIWSRSQMNGFKLNRSHVNLHKSILEKIEKQQQLIAAKQLSVELRVDEAATAWVDLNMLRIIVRNLLINAIKFTPSGGKIIISSHTNGAFITLGIRDSGVGIQEHDRQNLFSYNSTSRQGTASETGTGLGLKICKDLVELNAGKIRVESAVGRGSTFFIDFPINENLNETADKTDFADARGNDLT